MQTLWVQASGIKKPVKWDQGVVLGYDAGGNADVEGLLWGEGGDGDPAVDAAHLLDQWQRGGGGGSEASTAQCC